MSLTSQPSGSNPQSTLCRVLVSFVLISFPADAGARVIESGAFCSPTIVLAGDEHDSKAAQKLAAQLQRLIELSVGRSVRVPIKTARPANGTILDLRIDSSADVTTVIAAVIHDDELIKEIRPKYPTAATQDIAPYFAQGLLGELAVDWRTCDRAGVANPPDAAAYAMVRAATAADAASDDRAFDLATTALALDSNIAAGYMHLSQMLAERGEAGWAKIAEQQAKSIDPEALAYIPDIDPVPALRTDLAGAKWTKANTGLEMLSVANAAYDVKLYAWKVDPNQLDLTIKQAQTPGGESVQSLRRKFSGVFSINGGFFKEQTLLKENSNASIKALTSDGLLAVGGTLISEPWTGSSRSRGGILTLDKHRIRLMPSGEFDGKLGPNTSAIQSKPMLIEPGGKFAMYFDDGIVSKRSAVCTRKDGAAIFVVVDGKGVTLYQLARLLSNEYLNNQFECDAALALDGAVSSQASYAAEGGRVLDMPGRDIPYAIIANVPGQTPVIQ